VLVSVGFNNALPSSGILACSGSSGAGAAGYIDWALSEGTPKCVQAGVDWFARDYDAIFSTVADLLKGKRSLVAALTVHGGDLGHGDKSDFARADVPQKTMDRFDRWLVDAHDRWNTMLCARAKSHGVALSTFTTPSTVPPETHRPAPTPSTAHIRRRQETT